MNASKVLDLSSRPGEPDQVERVAAVLGLLRAGGRVVPVRDAARRLGVGVGDLLQAYGFARVRTMSLWVTSPAEVERVGRLLAGGRE